MLEGAHQDIKLQDERYSYGFTVKHMPYMMEDQIC